MPDNIIVGHYFAKNTNIVRHCKQARQFPGLRGVYIPPKILIDGVLKE